MRLDGHGDWQALIAAFEAVYLDAGSDCLHRDQVLAGIAALKADNPVIVPRPARDKPVCRNLPRAIALAASGPAAGLAEGLGAVADRIEWEYGYTEMPARLAETYAYCEIAGPRGPVAATGLILGFVLFAPDAFYPPHNHLGIHESYISVAGTWRQNRGASQPAGSVLYNPPGFEHAIATDATGPALLGWAWTGPQARLGTPAMTLSREPEATRQADRWTEP